LAGVLRKSVAATPEERYPCAAEFLVELARVAHPPASAPVIADFWDALFPVPQEEETGPDPTVEEAESLPAMVKEPGERYGRGGRAVQAAPPPRSPRSSSEASSCGRRCGNGRRSMRRRRRRSRSPRRSGAFRRSRGSPRVIRRPSLGSANTRSARGSRRARGAPRQLETDPPGASVLQESGAILGDAVAVGCGLPRGPEGRPFEDGYERQSVPAEALATRPTFRVELLPLIGTVEAIQAIPWAKSTSEPTARETPLTAVRLPAGEQRLRFVNEPLGVDQVKSSSSSRRQPEDHRPMTAPTAGSPDPRLPRDALVEGDLPFPLFRAGDLERQADRFLASGYKGSPLSPGIPLPRILVTLHTEGAKRRPAPSMSDTRVPP